MEPFEIADFQSQSKWHPFAGEATEVLSRRGGSPKWAPPLRVGRVGRKTSAYRCGAGFRNSAAAAPWSILWCQHGACIYASGIWQKFQSGGSAPCL